MFSKLFHKNTAPASPTPKGNGFLTPNDINPRISIHYGIPSSASVVAFDPFQSLLAVGTLDGRIKVIGGDNIEALLVSTQPVPLKNLEFLQNQGFLVSVSNENEIQVWDLEQRQLVSMFKWESNITAFAVIERSSYMYVGDEYGMIYILKYDAEQVQLQPLPYYVPTDAIAEASGMPSPNQCSVVGLFPQPSSHGNRLLIAYQDGLIILWDVSEDKVIVVKGNKDLQLKSNIMADSHKGEGHDVSDDTSEYEQVEKEISSLCWASTDGSILAVGYIDGDIMLWDLSNTVSVKDKQSGKSSNDVVKLQLSSADRRLPVIILRWSSIRSHKDSGGQLFVYGGDAIGSEEVVTILNLGWSSGIESLQCIGRIDLTLNGSFADMVLLPSSGAKEAGGTIVLTNPGQLHFYDDSYLSSLLSQQDRKSNVSPMQYPMVIPTIEPLMTVGKLGLVHRDGKLSKVLSEKISTANHQAASNPGSMKWPLTGGVPSELSAAESHQVERLYLAGYQDGTVRLWDATYPTFSLIYVLESEVNGINISGASASISTLEFCSFTLSLAVGNELGVVRLYKLVRSLEETSLYFVTENGKEVHNLHQGDGPHFTAVFSFLSSPVCTLKFVDFGTRLAVGFHSSQVAMLDISTLSVLFLTESLSESSSPVRSLTVRLFSDTYSFVDNPEDGDSKSLEDNMKCEVFLVTRDSLVVCIDGNTGSIICCQSTRAEKESTVIGMYIIESGSLIPELASGKRSFSSSQNAEAKCETAEAVIHCEGVLPKFDHETSTGSANLGQGVENSLLLLCWEDALYLYSLKSLTEGDMNPIQKVNLSKPCCWTTTFSKDGQQCGLIVLYHTGDIEVRTLPDLELLRDFSLTSILRWNFKTNMEKTCCSSENAQIMMVHGCEFACLSLLASENDFRIPESLPSLHDPVLAANADATFSSSQKKTQSGASGFLGGIIKGFQAGKVEQNVDLPEVFTNNYEHLETIFSNPPYLKPSTALANDQGVVELSIDDLDIDEPLHISYSTEKIKDDSKNKGTEKERLFEGASNVTEPRLRTADEIKAKYRKEDPAAAAAHAKEKLAERGEKLQMLSERTQELQDGAENFASMAHELAKQMEKRKWWNL